MFAHYKRNIESSNQFVLLLMVTSFILPTSAIRYASWSTTDNSRSSSGESNNNNTALSSGGSTTDNNAAGSSGGSTASNNIGNVQGVDLANSILTMHNQERAAVGVPRSCGATGLPPGHGLRPSSFQRQASLPMTLTG